MIPIISNGLFLALFISRRGDKGGKSLFEISPRLWRGDGGEVDSVSSRSRFNRSTTQRFYIFILLISLLITAVSCKSDKPQDFKSLPKYFYKKFEGDINQKLKITMNFFRQDTAIIGSYYYNNKKIPLEFTFNSHIDTSGNVYIEEGYFNQDNELIKTGMFIGRFINDRQIKGKWMKPDSSASYDFTLNENYDRGSSEFDIVHQEKSYGRCESGPCCFISYSYPKIVKFPNEDIESDLNKLFHDNVFKSFTEMPGIDSGKKYSHLEQIMDDFINSYKNDVENQKDIYKDWNPVWFFNKNILVDHNFNGIVSLTNVVDQFLGGAHPTAYIELLSIDMKKGKIIKLDDILKPGYKKNLTAIAEKIFRKSWKLAPNADLDTAGFFLENNKFYLNDNFYIQPNGLKFKFNQYEIAPYALGSPEIIIPYGQLKDLIRPDGVLNNLESDKF